MSRKTRKNCKKHKRDCNKDAKKGTLAKLKIKTFRSKMYQSVYGAARGGGIRSTRQLFY
jgi:hypothetical protein